MEENAKNNLIRKYLLITISLIIVGVLIFLAGFKYGRHTNLEAHKIEPTPEIVKPISPMKPGKKEIDSTNFSVVSYVTKEDLNVTPIPGGNYYIELAAPKKGKKTDKDITILDNKANVIYESKYDAVYDSYKNKNCNIHILEGKDNGLYIVYDGPNNKDFLSIYKIEDRVPKEVISVSNEGLTYEVVLSKEPYQKLFGFVAYKNGEQIKQYNLYTSRYAYTDYDLVPFGLEENQDNPLYIKNDDGFIITKNNKYGYNYLKEHKTTVPIIYDRIYDDNNGNLIAIKNNKAGIITKYGEVLVDFQYDFIDRSDNFFIISKNNKLAVMDNNYTIKSDLKINYIKNIDPLTDTENKYQYEHIPSKPNSFYGTKLSGGYLITTKDYKNNITSNYYINYDGRITNYNGEIIVLKNLLNDEIIQLKINDKKEIVRLNNELRDIGIIDAPSLSKDELHNIRYIDKYLIWEIKDKVYYYDLEIEREITLPVKFEYSANKVKFTYDFKDNKLKINDENKVVYEIGFNDFNEVLSNSNKFNIKNNLNSRMYLIKDLKELVIINNKGA